LKYQNTIQELHLVIFGKAKWVKESEKLYHHEKHVTPLNNLASMEYIIINRELLLQQITLIFRDANLFLQQSTNSIEIAKK
jgi:hypothetical protein